MTTYLLDANALIALTVSEHEHHEVATAWLATVDRFAVSPVVEGALVRFLLRIGERLETARNVLAGVHAAKRCEFWADAISYTAIDDSTVRGHRQVTDSYLAALARENSGRLATFDQALAARLQDVCVLITT